MRRMRLTIGRLMATLVILALNCALVRQLLLGGREGVLASAGGILMVNIIGFGFFRLVTRRFEGPYFLAGFMAAGFLALVVYEVALYVFTADVSHAINVAFHPVHDLVVSAIPPRLFAIYGARAHTLLDLGLLVLLAVALTIPQLAVAIAGGWLSHWAIGRRGSHAGNSGPSRMPTHVMGAG